MLAEAPYLYVSILGLLEGGGEFLRISAALRAMALSDLWLILLQEVLMKLSDVLLSVERNGSRVRLDTPSMPFNRSSDGVWAPDAKTSVRESNELFALVTKPSEVKPFIKDLTNSSCVMPDRIREELQALL